MRTFGNYFQAQDLDLMFVSEVNLTEEQQENTKNDGLKRPSIYHLEGVAGTRLRCC